MRKSKVFQIVWRETWWSRQRPFTSNSNALNQRNILFGSSNSKIGKCRIRHQERWYFDPNNECDTVSPDNLPITPYIGSCLTSSNKPPSSGDGTDFKINFLGTGAGCPSKERVCSATLLRIHGTSLLLDAAEGVQRQMMHTSAPLSNIRHILITHLHGDHLFGLPGLLLGLQVASQSAVGASGRSEGLTVNIYGPPGIYNYVAMSLSLSMSFINSGKIIVTELLGGHADPGYRPNNQKGGDRKYNHRDPRHVNYREMSRRNLHRKVLDQNRDGTWTFEVPSTGGPLSVSAAEVKHVNRVMTFGYVIQEEEPEPAIIVEKARALGIEPSKKYARLKKGESVESDDGSSVVHPEQVLAQDAHRKARKFALIGDNCQLSTPMYRLCQDCDVLVHEATLIGPDVARQAMSRGHATPETAGKVARETNAALLVMNHISAKIDPDEGGSAVEELARKTNNDVSYVVAAEDFMELHVPMKGFGRKKSSGQEEKVNIPAGTETTNL